MSELFDFKKLLKTEHIAAFFWIITAWYLFSAVDTLVANKPFSFLYAVRVVLQTVAWILLVRGGCEIPIVLSRMRAEGTKS